MRKIVIIRGPLGVGKTTVSKIVATKLDAVYISVDAVLSENKLDSDDGISLENFLKSNEYIAQICKRVESAVVIDGCFYHKEQIDDLLKRVGVPCVIVTLSAPLSECVLRDSKRDKMYGEASAEFVYGMVEKVKVGTYITSTNLTPEESAQAVMESLANRLPNNYAFIDSQNLNLGIRNQGWALDYKRFRVYLAERYGVTKAYMFLGYIPHNQGLYDRLQESGFLLKFRPVVMDADGNTKGNCDADLVLHAMRTYNEFDKAVIVSSDGDYYTLVQYFYEEKKLEVVLSPSVITCSTLLRKAGKELVRYMDRLKQKLEYIKRKAPLADETARGASQS
jgi:shikimate kinase/uncharacterized LabA/DUF88 family protein